MFNFELEWGTIPGIAYSNHVIKTPLGPKKPGAVHPIYRASSPTILSRHSVFRSYDRQMRRYQLANDNIIFRAFDCDEVPFPSAHLPKDETAKTFEFYLGLEFDDRAVNKRSPEYKAKHKHREAKLLHERDKQIYLSLYEYEHRILESVKIQRGLKPRVKPIVRSRHTRWED